LNYTRLGPTASALGGQYRGSQQGPTRPASYREARCLLGKTPVLCWPTFYICSRI